MAELGEDIRLVEGQYYGFVIESPSSVVNTATRHLLSGRGLDSTDLPPEERGEIGWRSIWLLKVRDAMTVLAAKQNVIYAASEGSGVRLRESWVHVHPSRLEDPTLAESFGSGLENAGEAVGNAVSIYVVGLVVIAGMAIYFLGPTLVKELV